MNKREEFIQALESLGPPDPKAAYIRLRDCIGIDFGMEPEQVTKTIKEFLTKIEKIKETHPDANAVLELLNELTGRSYRPTPKNLSFISARLSEKGVTTDGVKEMLHRQCLKWKGTDMEEYLRPETLFNATKFDSYYASRKAPLPTPKPVGRENTRNAGLAEKGQARKESLYRMVKASEAN